MNVGSSPPRGSLAVAYGRFSTDTQNPRSADDQIAMLCEIAGKAGWQVVRSEKDEGVSGAQSDREGFLRIAEAAHNREFSVLMVEGLERLSRNRADLFQLYDNVLKPNGIRIYVARSNSIMDDTAMMLLAWKAGEDLTQLKQQVQRGQNAVIADGRLCGSTSYGYRKRHDDTGQNGLREVFEHEAEVVRRIFKEYEAGRSPLEIAKGLNGDGIPSPRGKTWNPGVILGNGRYGSGILRNRLYKGEFVWRRTQKKSDSKRGNRLFVQPSDKHDQMIVHKPELAIVADDLFDAVQSILMDGQVPSVAEIGKKRKPEYLFSGKITCGICGEKYNVLSGSLGCVGRALKGSRCSNNRRTRREDLETAVLQGLASRLLDAELLDKVVGEYRAEAQRACEQQRATSDRAIVRTRILETKSTNIRGQLSEMDPKSQSAALMRQDLEEVLSELETAKRTSRQAAAAMPTAKSTAEIIEALQLAIANLRQLLAQFEPEAARARDKLRALVDEIVVQPFDDGYQDGRGGGPVVVTVVGWLSRLLELADGPVGRVFLSREGMQTCQEHASLQFFYSVEIANERSDAARQVAGDARWMRRLLTQSAEPLRQQDLLRKFQEQRSLKDEKDCSLRVRRALERLDARGQLAREALGREVMFQAPLHLRNRLGKGGHVTMRGTPVLLRQGQHVA